MARYYSISLLALALDVGLFSLFIALAIPAVAAAGASYGLAAGAHFVANRWLNFRAFDRPVASQAGTYAGVLFCAWLVTVLTVAVATKAFGAAPLAAKALAVVITLPIGYFGHKYLTFGGGFRVAFATALRRRSTR